MQDAILVIDQGTTSTRAIVFTPQGTPVAAHQLEHGQIYPQPGWVEHCPEELWANTLKTCHQAIKIAEEKGFQPVSLGITNQRETVVAWNKRSGEVLHNALVWQDGRTSDFCQKIAETHGEAIRAKTGLPTDPYFSASKMHWLMENVAAVKAAAQKRELAFGTVESFLLWRLSGGKVHKTDITNACRTLLFNIHSHAWDNDLLEIFNIPAHSLPEVFPNTSDFATTAPDVLPLSLPVEAMAGDQQAATVGQACLRPGMVKSTYGTGCFVMLNTGEQPRTSNHGLLTTIGYQVAGSPPIYALEGSIFVAGAAVQWLRDRLGVIASATETEALAAGAPQTDDVYLVPAFAGLGAPHWRPKARAALTGMSLDTGKSTLVRATLDAVAYQTHDLLTAMAADTTTPLHSLRVDGGMTKNDWFMQRLANITNLPVERPQTGESTALGAAMLAALAHGFHRNLSDIEPLWQRAHRHTPTMDGPTRNALISGWEKAVKNLA